MQSFLRNIIALLALTPLLGCGALHAWSFNSTCYYPDTRGVVAPDWVCTPPATPDLITAVGYAPRSAAGDGFSRQMAIADARVRLGKRLQGQCGRANITEAMLLDSRVQKMQRSPRGGYYVEVGVHPSGLRLDCR